MSTNDTIIGAIEKGSFHFPIEFNMFGNHQYIPDATFDTGCSHSLISVKSLNTGNMSIDDLKKEALYDLNIKLGIGKGIESKNINTDQIKADIRKINCWKRQLEGMDNATDILNAYITEETKSRIFSSRLVRYEYKASDYEIDGVKIGNFEVRVSFDISKVNLIGMHIIRKLYTKIFCYNNKIFLLAKKNSSAAGTELDITMTELREQLELFGSKV